MSSEIYMTGIVSKLIHTHTHWACILSGDFLILDFSQQEEAIPEANDEAIDGLSHKVAALNAWFNTSDLF